MKTIFYILLFFNALILSACILGLSMEGSALSEGDFVNNPTLFTFAFLFNTVCFGLFLQYDMYDFKHAIWSFVLIFFIIVLNIITVVSEFPLKNDDKTFHLVILGATAFYLAFIVIEFPWDLFLKKFRKNVLS